MTWVIIIWWAAIFVWFLALAGNAGSASNSCASQAGGGSFASQFCQNYVGQQAATHTGAILIVGFIGFVVLAIIWFMRRPQGRDCPACGDLARRGVTICGGCGFDFSAAARRGAPERTIPAVAGQSAQGTYDPSTGR